jgi:hypothetical protein
LKASRKYYEMALKIYIGQELIKRIEGVGSLSPLSEIHENLMVHGKDGTGRWVDISGLFSPACKIEALIDSVKSGKIGSITELHEALRDIFSNYNKYVWEWCAELIGRQTGSEPGNISVSTIIRIITDWKINAIKFNNMILKDAEKEFDGGAKLGFGIDGDETTREMDFEVVRGVYNENKFISGLQKESACIEEKADRLIALLEKIQ